MLQCWISCFWLISSDIIDGMPEVYSLLANYNSNQFFSLYNSYLPFLSFGWWEGEHSAHKNLCYLSQKFCPIWAWGNPTLTHSLSHFLIFYSIFYFSLFPFLALMSIFLLFHPFPFYQNRCVSTHFQAVTCHSFFVLILCYMYFYGCPMEKDRPLYFCPVVSIFLSIYLFFIA